MNSAVRKHIFVDKEMSVRSELSQTRYDYHRRVELQERYDYTTIAVLDELLLGFLRRQTCSGLGVVEYLESRLSKHTGIGINKVKNALVNLEKDGIIYRHKPSDFILVYEFWRHNRIENPSISANIIKVVNQLPKKCGPEVFECIAYLFEKMAELARNGDSSFCKPDKDKNREQEKRANAVQRYQSVAIAAKKREEEFKTLVLNTCVRHKWETQEEVGSRNEAVGSSFTGPSGDGDEDEDDDIEAGPLSEYSENGQEYARQVIEFFRAVFKERRGIEHPPINGSCNLLRMLHIIDVLVTSDGVENIRKNLGEIIDIYFRRKYQEGCNYQFWHFATDRVWGNIAVQLYLIDNTDYFEQDGTVKEAVDY